MIALTNTILSKLRKHLEFYNFQEQAVNSNENTPHAQKFFTIDTQNKNQVSITISPSLSILDDAWIIKIIDSFLKESLFLETYFLKINYPKKDCSELKKTLNILSVSFVEQPTLKTNFQFSIREHGQTYNLSSGERQETHNALTAHLYVENFLILEQKIALPISPALHVIVPLNQEQTALALLIASKIHMHDRCVDVFLPNSAEQDNLERARKMCAKYMLLLGEEEQKNGTITIKNLHANSAITVKQTQILEYI